MNAVAMAGAGRASRPAAAAHVVAGAGVLPSDVARLASLIEVEFLTEAGWDPVARVLSIPAGHRLLGWTGCSTPGCARQAYDRDGVCGRCRHHRAEGGDDQSADGVVPVRPGSACAVAACGRARGARRYCRAHYERLLRRRGEAGFDESRWCRTEPAVEEAGQVSLHGIAAPLVMQVLYGLQQRTREGAKTNVAVLRQVAWELRALQPAGLDQVDAGSIRDQHKLVRCFARHARRALLQPETECVKDVWDLTAFGLAGVLDFTRIRQPWLRETTKRWAADDLPKRRGKDPVAPVRHYLTGVAALSDGLHAARDDHGVDPARLGRADIDTFLQRMAFLTGQERLSPDARVRITREVKHLLGRFRALGLTRPGGPAAGLGEDFALAAGEVPRQSADPEANRDLPVEIMRQLCEHLPVLEDSISSREVRVAVELIIDTGRRPDEICTLAWDCVEHDPDGAPVLVYDNHKNARPGRRLPIGQATADLINGQKARVRARFPATAPAQLKLLPAAYANPDGRRAISENQLCERHRAWVAALPPLLRADGSEYDKTRVVPYAYRHTYAQRHADAGVAIDVLATLMNHRSLNTTKHYYRVGHARRREAVDRVSAMQFDAHGNRIWRAAHTMLDGGTHAAGVPVPFGTCTEPSNVTAVGHACTWRFRCTSCDHFRGDRCHLPDLHTWLEDLLTARERHLAEAGTSSQPADPNEEITTVRRLINRIRGDLDELTDQHRERLQAAVDATRQYRTGLLDHRLEPTP